MALPTSNLSSSNVNVELNYPANTDFSLNQKIVRQLTGLVARQTNATSINGSDLTGKYAYASLLGSGANTQAGFGTQGAASLVLSINSSFYTPNVVWSVDVTAGSNAGLTITPSGDQRSATLTLQNPSFGTSRTANTLVTATIYIDGFLVGAKSVTANLTSTVYDAALAVTGPTSVNTSGYVAQTSFASISATANASLSNASIQFVATKVSGTTLNPIVTGNTISFQVDAGTEGQTNASTYSLVTNLIYNGSVIQSNTRNVQIQAQYLTSSIDPGVDVVNVMAVNSGSVTSSVTTTPTKVPASGTITWSITGTGNTVAATISSNTSQANVSITRSANGEAYGDYTLTANLYASTGEFLKSVQRNIKLGAVSFGIGTTGTNDVQTGYVAQTAFGTASASAVVGTLAWSIVANNGVGTTNIAGNPAMLTAAASGFGTTYATRTFRATYSRTLYGTTVTAFKDQAVTSNATYYNPAFSVAFTPSIVTGFTTVAGAMSATGTVAASANASMTGASYTYSTTLTSGTAASITGSGANRSFAKSTTGYNTNTATYSVTVTLFDGATQIAQQASSLTITAAKYDPALSSAKYDDSTTGSGTVTSIAGIQSVSSNTSIPSRSYSHTFTLVSGSAAATSGNSSTGAATVTVTATAGVTNTAVYDITLNVLSGATVLESVTHRVTSTATSYNPLTATTTDSTPSKDYWCTGRMAGCPSVTLTTPTVTISPSGGTGSYSYSWTRLSGDTGTTISNAAAASVTFSRSTGRDESYSSVWRCTITSGTQTYTVDHTVSFSYVFEDLDCVVVNSFIWETGVAGNIKLDDYIAVVDPATLAADKVKVTRSTTALVGCVRLTTATGIVLECSKTAPIAIVDGDPLMAVRCLNKVVYTMVYNKVFADTVVSVEDIGLQAVQHITCENKFFAAGKYEGRYLLHHNVKM